MEGIKKRWQEYTELHKKDVNDPDNHMGASLATQLVNYLPAMQDTGFYSWVRKIPWRRKWQPTPLFLPGESRGAARVKHELVSKPAPSAMMVGLT